MKHFRKRLTALAAAALMVIGMIPMGPVVEAKADETTYVLDATALDATGVNDKDPVAEGTMYADGYFKVVGAVTQRTNSDGTMKALEIAKALKGAMQFTVNGTADVTLHVSSTGGGNTSEVAIIDENGVVVANNEGLTQVSTTTATVLTYTGLPAGTYQLVSPENPENSVGRIIRVDVIKSDIYISYSDGSQVYAGSFKQDKANRIIGFGINVENELIIYYSNNTISFCGNISN